MSEGTQIAIAIGVAVLVGYLIVSKLVAKQIQQGVSDEGQMLLNKGKSWLNDNLGINL